MYYKDIEPTLKLGAFYKGRLIAVMTFAVPSISKGQKCVKGNIWELSRFCTSTRITGITGKILEHFKRNYKWSNIFSYADLRWSDGNVYNKVGFEYTGNSAPNYWYVYKKNMYEKKRYHRFNFRKDVLNKKLEVFDPKKTEYENMLINGWDRIWDCGDMKFEMKNPGK